MTGWTACARRIVCARLGQAEVLDLALLDQVFHRARHVLDRHVGVDAVLVVEIDDVGPEALERSLATCLDVLRAAVELRRHARLEIAELGGNHHLIAKGSKRFAHEFLVRERTVELGGVEEGDAALHGCTDQRDHFLLVRGWSGRAVDTAHAHAAKPERRDFQRAKLAAWRSPWVVLPEH